MSKKLTGYRLQATVLILCFILIALFLLPPNAYRLMPVLAQQTAACPTQSSNPRVTDGLISSSSITDNKFSNNTGTCVVDPNKAPFVPYKIPNYDDLKSIYYTQSKAPKTSSDATIITPITPSDDGKIFDYTAADVNINGVVYNYNGTAVIFIDGNINIKGDVKALASTKGLVFVVKGNIIIDQSVTQIDAILISSGYIYTAGPNCNSSAVSASQLVINGSLISLNEANNIKFCRTLANNATSAEKINYQPKYLVILRNLFSDTLQKWSEVQ